MGFVVGIDVGGTHTDLVATDGNDIKVEKVPSKPKNPTEAVLSGLEMIANDYGIGIEEFLKNCDRFVYGSTIATNIFVSHTTPKIGLLTTKGHRDILWFRDAYKPERWNLHYPPLWEMVPRYLRMGIEERVNYRGEVLIPLNEGDVRTVAKKFKEREVETVAICFLWSFIRPEHERRAREIIEEELPGIPVVISYEVLPVIREWERSFCTALSAAIAKEVGSHLRDLRNELIKRGLKREPLVMQANGGVATIDTILKRLIYMVASGPAGGAIAGRFYGMRWGAKGVMTADMGGTSFDVALLPNMEIMMTQNRKLEHEPVAIPCVDVHTIGAGGGSIAWIDPGGGLQVGPHSAGAEPGPACYGKGGEEPTVTDAYLILGYINPKFFLGGRYKLYPELAERAIREKIAKPLGEELIDAAWQIVQISNSQMADAMRLVSVQRGIDPEPFTLVVGGGAGPIPAGKLIEAVGIRRIVVPRDPGGLCSLGMINADLKYDAMGSYTADSARMDMGKLTKSCNELEQECREALLAQGILLENIQMTRFVNACYSGQVYEVETPIPTAKEYGPEHIPQIIEEFEEAHYKLYHYKMTGFPVHITSCRVQAIGKVPAIKFTEMEFAGKDASVALKGKRTIYSPEKQKLVEADIYDCNELKYGNVLRGLAIIESKGSTLVVLENQRLTVGKYGDFCIEFAEPSTSKL